MLIDMIHKYQNKKPKIHKTAFVAPSADVIGDVTVGEDSSLWFGASVRGDEQAIIIGKRTSIQDNTSVHVCPRHPTIIKDDVTVGHNAVIHGCTVNSNCIIAIGAILLNGCVIGKDSIIGAGAVVMENQKIPPRSLAVGIPAKVIRKLSDNDVKVIKENADEYVKLAKTYLKEKL